jgi:hypothetical protein|tara:strand:+ start:126 stop:464 length:339 start_codon:yes stop_codon:yes gene_type:complete
MANIYKNVGFAIGTTNLTTIYTVPAGRTAIVKSIQASNTHSGNNLVRVSLTDTSASATYQFAHNIMATATTNNALLSPMIMEAGDLLKIQVGTVDTIEGVVSYLEIFDEKST